MTIFKIRSNAEVHGVEWAARHAMRQGDQHKHGALRTLREVLSVKNCNQSFSQRWVGAMLDSFNHDCAEAIFHDYLGAYCAGGEL